MAASCPLIQPKDSGHESFNLRGPCRPLHLPMQAVQTNAKAIGLLYPESSREGFYSHVLKAPEST